MSALHDNSKARQTRPGAAQWRTESPPLFEKGDGGMAVI
jgi:hypothetical protein